MGFRLFSVFSLFASVAAAAASPCSMEELCKNYRSGYENSAGEHVRSKFAPGFNWKQFQTAENETRLQNLFGEAKQRLIGVLQQETLLSEEVRQLLVARVNSVVLSPQLDRGDAGYGGGFWGDGNCVLAANSVAELPKANLINFFAHELSHSFDSTALSYSIVKTGDQYIQNIEEANPSSKMPGSVILSRPVSTSEMIAVTSTLTLLYDADGKSLDEAQCDYFASKVSAGYLSELPATLRATSALEGQMDIVVSACNHPEIIDEVHGGYTPERTRVEKIYFGNTTIAEAAGCGTSFAK